MKKIVTYFYDTLKMIQICYVISYQTSKKYTILRFVLELGVAIIPLLTMMINRHFVDSLIEADESSYKVLVLLFTCSILALYFQRSLDYVNQELSDYLTKELTNKNALKCMKVGIRFYDSVDNQNLLQNVRTNINSLATILWNAFSAFKFCIIFLYSFILVARINGFFGIGVVAAQIPYLLFSRKIAKENYTWYLSNLKKNREYSYYQSISADRLYSMDISIFGLEDYLHKKMKSLSYFLFVSKRKMNFSHYLGIVVTMFIPEIMELIISWRLVGSVMNGLLTVGTFVLYTGLLGALSSSVYNVTSRCCDIYSDRMRIHSIYQFDTLVNDSIEEGNEKLQEINEICFSNISFKYPNSDAYTLNDLSFCIRRGEHVCITGINGSGKTTIIKLLLRLYEPNEGAIKINGINIKEYSLDSLYSTVSVYFPTSMLFAETVKENIYMGNLNKNDFVSMINAINLVDDNTILKKISPDTFMFKLFDDRGYQPSTGEIRKLCIARSIYRGTHCMIFDEPSSSLDPIAENTLFTNLVDMLNGQTFIYTAHRLSATKFADRIIVIHHGAVAEDGTFETLMDHKRLFYSMHTEQLGRNES